VSEIAGTASPPRYVGTSRLLRRCPNTLMALGLAQFLFFTERRVVGAVLIVLGTVPALVLPWRFVVVDEGIALWFGFGRRRFLARDSVTVRVDRAGAVARPRGERFGYPLTDGIVERRRPVLRAVLVEHGFDVG